MRHKNTSIIYLIICFAMLLIPSAGLFIGGREDSAENSRRADKPSVLTEDKHLNMSYLPQAGTWFEENFAWRQELVSVNSKLMSHAGVSADDGVILGKDGWLYYRDSLDDYQGTNLLSDRALYDIARTAKMTQDYCSYLDISYIFMVVPNKASVYPEYMPYYLAHRESEDSNRIRLRRMMESENVSYMDAGDVLEPEAETRRTEDGKGRGALPFLYHRTDSHWTNEGAAMCADELLSRVRVPHRSYKDADYEIRKDFVGDLERMLYPALSRPEDQVYYNPEPSFEYVGEVESSFDYYINTVGTSGGGSLVMYRDSFANALLPFLAENFDNGYFSRGIPENVTFDTGMYNADCVIMEHAERNLPDTSRTVPVLQSLPSDIVIGDEGLRRTDADITMSEEEANPYYTRIEGVFSGEIEPGVRILADTGDGTLYEAMPRHLEDNREGFVMYLPADSYPADGSAPEPDVYLLGA